MLPACTSMETASVIINETVGVENLPKYIVASAAVPGIYPYSIEDNKVLVDGGTIDNINVVGGIDRCREIVGDDDNSIIVDVMMTNSLTKHTWMNLSDAKSYTLYMRGSELTTEARGYWYITEAMKNYPNVQWRYFIMPKEALPNYPVIALSFDRETLKKTEEIGYNITKELILSNKGNFQEQFKLMASRVPHKIRLH